MDIKRGNPKSRGIPNKSLGRASPRQSSMSSAPKSERQMSIWEKKKKKMERERIELEDGGNRRGGEEEAMMHHATGAWEGGEVCRRRSIPSHTPSRTIRAHCTVALAPQCCVGGHARGGGHPRHRTSAPPCRHAVGEKDATHSRTLEHRYLGFA